MGRPRKTPVQPLTETYSAELPPTSSGLVEEYDWQKNGPFAETDQKFEYTTQSSKTAIMAATKHRYQDQINYWERDEYGLLPQVNYVFKDDEPQKIDWKKMLPSKHLLINRGKFPEGTDFTMLNVEELEENQLILSLAGFKYLLDLRGYTAVRKYIDFASEGFVSMRCEIDFIPNHETGMLSRTFVGEADAHFGNTKGFGPKFLTAMAGNRALERAVKDGLGLNILGLDELEDARAGSPQEDNTTSYSGSKPVDALREKMKKLGVTFDKIKSRYIKDGESESATEEQKKWSDKAAKWVSENDLSPIECFAVIGRIEDKLKAKNPIPE